MTKYTLELFSVHRSFKVKFCVVVEQDEIQPNGQKQPPVVSKTFYYGNQYLSIRPHPFLTIDITNRMERNEEWSSNRSFNMNRKDKFIMCKKLAGFLQMYKEEKDLFYYDENHSLIVNKELADKKKITIICGQKTVLIIPCVVDNEEDHLQYEGAVLVINSMDYFSYLTYTELEYFLFELRRVDFNALTADAFTYMEITKNTPAIQLPSLRPPVIENTEKNIIDTKPLRVEQVKTMPEI